MIKQSPVTVKLPFPDRRLNPNNSKGKHPFASVPLRNATRVNFEEYEVPTSTAQPILGTNTADAKRDGHHLGQVLCREALFLDMIKRHGLLGRIGNAVNSVNLISRPVVAIGGESRRAIHAVITFIPWVERLHRRKCAHERFSHKSLSDCDRGFAMPIFYQLATSGQMGHCPTVSSGFSRGSGL
jgi:hypothetical protein